MANKNDEKKGEKFTLPDSKGSSGVPNVEDVSYVYPNNLDLRPDSDMHKRILQLVLSRAKRSNNEMKKQFSTWNEIDRSMRAFISTDMAKSIAQTKDDKLRASKAKSALVIPVGYASKEVILTYLLSIFGSTPLWKYEPTAPEDTIPVALLERVIERQNKHFKNLLSLYTSWNDMLKYSIGGIVPDWVTVYGRRVTLKDGLKVISNKEVVFEGNKFLNIDPYTYLPDISVPVNDVQSSEYAGWVTHTTYQALLAEENAAGSELFNVEYVKYLSQAESSLETTVSGRAKVDGRANTSRTTDRTSAPSGSVPTQNSLAGYVEPTARPVDTINMYVRLVPNDHGISNSTEQELWFFQVTGDQIVTAATKTDFVHDSIPIAIGAPSYNGHDFIAPSILEMSYPLQEQMNNLFYAHMMNIKRALRNVYVADPSVIWLPDLLNPDASVIRTTRRGWGQPVRDYIHQLQVTDFTRDTMHRDIAFMMDVHKGTNSTYDSVQGQISQKKERVSATESRDSRMSNLSRLMSLAKIMSIQEHQDLQMLQAHNTIQYSTKKITVQTLGRKQQVLQKIFGGDVGAVEVDPIAMITAADFTAHDDAFMMNPDAATMFETVLGIIERNPVLLQKFDSTKLALGAIQSVGFQDPEAFLATAQDAGNLGVDGTSGDMPMKTMTSDMIKQMVAKGDLQEA